MASDLLESFAQLVVARTGVRIGSLGDTRLLDQLQARIKEQAGGDSAAYLTLLQTGAPEGQHEWEKLIALVTNGETFFFRDRGQFALLKEKILPELIEHAREKRSLRIWSAGCSTGEEPYSLAILLDELLPVMDEWDIWILGTDLNTASLERAREGRYGRWSFRLVAPDLIAKYFHHQGDTWRLDERIRRMVTFRPGNLVEDFAGYRSSDRFQWDLILCRNVFLYFDEAKTSAVMAQFQKLLGPGGYLMTGHNEVYPFVPQGLCVRSFPDSVLFQRQDQQNQKDHKDRSHSPHRTAWPDRHQQTHSPQQGSHPDQHPSRKRSAPRRTHGPTPAPPPAAPNLAEARSLLRQGLTEEATAIAQRTLKEHPNDVEALRLMAQAHANSGRHQEAMKFCRRVLTIDYTDVPAHFLLAKIAEEQGDVDRARTALEKALYLDPSFVPAHLELAFLHEQAGNRSLARNQFQAAAELLKALPASTHLEWVDDLPAGELLARIAGVLAEEPDESA